MGSRGLACSSLVARKLHEGRTASQENVLVGQRFPRKSYLNTLIALQYGSDTPETLPVLAPYPGPSLSRKELSSQHPPWCAITLNTPKMCTIPSTDTSTKVLIFYSIFMQWLTKPSCILPNNNPHNNKHYSRPSCLLRPLFYRPLPSDPPPNWANGLLLPALSLNL